MYEDMPDPRSKDGQERLLREIGERAVAAAHDNASDMGYDREAIEHHVGICLESYVQAEFDQHFPPIPEDDEYMAKWFSAAYNALYEQALEAARDVAEEKGYTIYVPREEAKAD